MKTIKIGFLLVTCLLLALFFIFVGYWKVVGTADQLEQHGAWVIHLPMILARMIGFSEILSGILLLVVPWGRFRPIVYMSLWGLIVNQFCAGIFHIIHAEFSAFPQNLVLISLLLCCMVLIRGLAVSPTSVKVGAK